MALGKQLIVPQSPYIKYKLWEMIIQPHKYEAKNQMSEKNSETNKVWHKIGKH